LSPDSQVFLFKIKGQHDWLLRPYFSQNHEAIAPHPMGDIEIKPFER
jgi:hypothetical protein